MHTASLLTGISAASRSVPLYLKYALVLTVAALIASSKTRANEISSLDL